MANRVTGAEVLEIMIDSSLLANQIEAFIASANLIVTEKLASSSFLDARLKEIERWLAAHLIATVDKGVKSEKLGDVSFTYDGQTGMGLDATTYGQQVKILDTTGTLANLGKKLCTFENIDND